MTAATVLPHQRYDVALEGRTGRAGGAGGRPACREDDEGRDRRPAAHGGEILLQLGR